MAPLSGGAEDSDMVPGLLDGRETSLSHQEYPTTFTTGVEHVEQHFGVLAHISSNTDADHLQGLLPMVCGRAHGGMRHKER